MVSEAVCSATVLRAWIGRTVERNTQPVYEAAAEPTILPRAGEGTLFNQSPACGNGHVMSMFSREFHSGCEAFSNSADKVDPFCVKLTTDSLSNLPTRALAIICDEAT